MNKPTKNKHDAATTVTVVKWLIDHKDSFKDYTWQQAMFRFNSEYQTKVAPKTFKEAVISLEIQFKSPTRSSKPSSQPPGFGIVLAKTLRILIQDIEKAVGGKIASDKVNTILSMIIGKKTTRELEEYINQAE